MKVRECAYWPEIHHFLADGETMGRMAPTHPKKVDHLLQTKSFRFMWYQDDLNLFDLKLVGPFDFDKGHKVPDAAWKELLALAEQRKVYVGNVNRIIPLDEPDRQDKDRNGTYTSWMASTWRPFH